MTQISASAPAAHLDVGQGSLRLGQGWVLGRLYGNSRGMSAPGPNRKYSLRASDLRSTPESGLKSDIRPCPKSATTGLMQRSKQDCYSITSSARTSNDVGTSRPSAFAVNELFFLASLAASKLPEIKPAAHADVHAGVAMSLATRSEISGARSALCGLSKWVTSVRSF